MGNKKMTEDEPTMDEMTAGTDDVVDATEDAVEPAEITLPDDEPDDDAKVGREAAKYRRRLRETEAERDALTARVEALQRGTVDNLVTTVGRMRTAEPFWAAGVEVAELLDDDGGVDQDKVLKACDDVAERFGIMRRPRPNYVPGEGANPRPTGTQGMVDALRSKPRY